MENFFYETEFCPDIEWLVNYLFECSPDQIQYLDDSWSVKVELTSLEKMFTLDMETIQDGIDSRLEDFIDRFPEDSNDLFDKIRSAVAQSVDLEKLNSLIPELYYPNGTFATITKQDLIDWQT